VVDMRVVVGSTNPVKIKAVQKAMTLIFPDVKIDVAGVEVNSGVSNQPLSFEEIVLGARNRAKNAMKKVHSDFSIGLEAGIVRIPYTLTGWIDYAFCAILDKNGIITLGSSPGFEYPPIVIQRVLNEKLEIGVIMDELVNEKDVKKKQGAVGFLSKGLFDRVEFLKTAVIMAFIPRINDNPKLYNLVNK